MKKLSLAFSAMLVLLTSCGGERPNFSGKVSGSASDTMLIYYSTTASGKWMSVDTIALNDGYFEMEVKDTTSLKLYLAAKPKYGVKEATVAGDIIYFFPGDKIQLSGEMPGGVVARGTELYDGLAKNEEYLAWQKKRFKLDKQIRALKVEEKDKKAELVGRCEKVDDSLNVVKMEMIRENPNSLTAGFLSLNLPAEMGSEAMKLLPEEVKNSYLAVDIANAAKNYQRLLELAKARESIQPGKIAPDFTLPDLDGKQKSLSDFRGKYVVVDFWGTWCGWCIAGFPEMKTYYAKYSKQVEFVGVSSYDKEANWRKTVANHELPWVNLFDNGDKDVVHTYGISGFPTKVVIDPEGKIVEVFEGEGKEFYEKMDSLFK